MKTIRLISFKVGRKSRKLDPQLVILPKTEGNLESLLEILTHKRTSWPRFDLHCFHVQSSSNISTHELFNSFIWSSILKWINIKAMVLTGRPSKGTAIAIQPTFMSLKNDDCLAQSTIRKHSFSKRLHTTWQMSGEFKSSFIDLIMSTIDTSVHLKKFKGLASLVVFGSLMDVYETLYELSLSMIRWRASGIFAGVSFEPWSTSW